MASLVAVSLLLLAFSSSLRICSPRKVELGINKNKAELPKISNLTTFLRLDPSKAVQISWHPRLFLYKSFLSDEECDHLTSLAQGKLANSLVLDNGSANSTVSKKGVLLAKGQDEIIMRIEERISAWTLLPKEHGEEMQILHHRINESYKPYYDYDHDRSKQAFSGYRLATVLMYLSNATLGGETIFPKSELRTTQAKDDTWSRCSANSYGVKPVKGNALLLFNLNPDATPDESSLHDSCEVLEGEKWTATKWIHVRAFDPKKATLASDGECTDEDENCSRWAAVGECERNPVYMLGTQDYYGTCRKSCGAC